MYNLKIGLSSQQPNSGSYKKKDNVGRNEIVFFRISGFKAFNI